MLGAPVSAASATADAPTGARLHATRCMPAAAEKGSGVGRHSADVFGMPPAARPPPPRHRRRHAGAAPRAASLENVASVAPPRRGSRASPVRSPRSSGSSRWTRRSADSAPAARPSAVGVPLSPPWMTLIASAGLNRYASALAHSSRRSGAAALMSSITQKPRPCVRDDEIVAVDFEVAHRRHRQVELQRLPVVAVVERDERAALGAGERAGRAARDLP